MNKNFSISEIAKASNNILDESLNNLTIKKNNSPEPLLLINEISKNVNIDEKIKNEIIKELYIFFNKKIKKNTLKVLLEQRVEIKNFQREINYLSNNKKILETTNHNHQAIIDKIFSDKKKLETNNHNLQANLDQIIQDKRMLTGKNKNMQADLSFLKDKLKNNLSNEKNLNNEKLIASNDKLKFYQEDNLRLSNELFTSNERHNITKKQLHNFELQKNQISNQIQELNNSIKESNLITPAFTDNLPSEAKEDLKKTNDKGVDNLNNKINKIFDKL